MISCLSFTQTFKDASSPNPEVHEAILNLSTRDLRNLVEQVTST
jgi:hypothetical protein